MNISAIITEYNPFHQGHALQLSQIKSDYVVAIMSGNYVQRGEPALLDKWTRAEMALANGIDLVLELPTSISSGSAEFFGKGAVFLLNQSNIIDNLVFGAEHPYLEDLSELAHFFSEESAVFSAALQQNLKQGLSFAAARQAGMELFFPDSNFGDILKGSNNILAIEYLKSLQLNHSKINPILIHRKGQSYLDSEYQANTILSATAIRKLILHNTKSNYHFLGNNSFKVTLKKSVPLSVYRMLTSAVKQNNRLIFAKDIYPYIQFLLLHQSQETLLSIWDLNQELLNRLYKFLNQDLSFEDYVSACSSRNFPNSRVRRALLHIFLNQVTPEPATTDNSYLKVLGFRKKSSSLVRHLQKNSNIPIITNTRNIKQLSSKAYNHYQKEITYDKLYGELIYNKYGYRLHSPEQRNPIIYG